MSHVVDANHVGPLQQRWRLFCAIVLTPDVRKRVTGHVARLREVAPNARASWARDEALHITLKFIGEIDTARIDLLSRAATRAAESVQSFALTIEGAGVFPPRGLPRVLWLGIIDLSRSMARLHQRLEAECQLEGFACEKRAFHPHLTVARLRTHDDAEMLAASHHEIGFDATPVNVSELVVMRSELASSGSHYTVISRHSLKRV